MSRDATRSHLGLERARLAVAMGKWSTAYEILRAALAESPDHPEILGLYAYVLAQQGGDLDAAREACSRAVAMQPYAAHLRAYLGAVYRAAGLETQARDAFQTALRLDPAQSLASLALGGAAAGETPPRPRRGRAWPRRLGRRRATPRPT
jgi:tetratricopeptide (TPR) repeat protein